MSRRLPLLALLGALLTAGCAPQPADCARPELYCAGLVTDLGPADAGLPRQAWLALQEARAAQLVDRVDVIATVDRRDRQANIRVLADDGYDLIVTAGASMTDITAQAAREYPRLKFIGIDQPQETQAANLSALVFREDQGGFLAGVLAARMSQTAQVAAVCESGYVDSIRRYCEGFVAGARYARPDIQATAVHRQGPSERLFNDPGWGRAAALAQVAGGADVLFAAGGRTADAALEAAAAQGAYVIGSGTDLFLDLPGARPRLLSSAVNDVRSSLTQIITLTRQDRFPAGEFMGSVELAPWHDLERQVPLETRQELERLRIDLSLEVIQPGVPYDGP